MLDMHNLPVCGVWIRDVLFRRTELWTVIEDWGTLYVIEGTRVPRVLYKVEAAAHWTIYPTPLPCGSCGARCGARKP